MNDFLMHNLMFFINFLLIEEKKDIYCIGSYCVGSYSSVLSHKINNIDMRNKKKFFLEIYIFNLFAL